MNWKDAPVSRFICYCKKVTKESIIRAIKNGARDLDDIKLMTLACTGTKCKTENPHGVCCEKDVVEMIAFYTQLTEALHRGKTPEKKRPHDKNTV
jgi:bacterioferritin-associated ferredoxin